MKNLRFAGWLYFFILLIVVFAPFFTKETEPYQVPKLSSCGRSDFEIFGEPLSLENLYFDHEQGGGWPVSVSVSLSSWSDRKSPMQLQVFLPKDLEGKVRLNVQESWLYRNGLVDQGAIRMDFSMYELGYAAGFRFWQSIDSVEEIDMQLVIVPKDNVEILEKYKNGLSRGDVKVYAERLIGGG